jgi:L-ascorbate metabolism protein UlaG (beta-lactamase superfamily)
MRHSAHADIVATSSSGPPDPTIDPTINVTYVGHATVLVEMNGARILTDPVLRHRVGCLRNQHRKPQAEWLRGLDAVLISHLHLDHMDPPSLRLLGLGTRLIVPEGAGSVFRRLGFHRVDELRPEATTAVGGITVSGTPAIHTGRRFLGGPEAGCLGFLLRGDYQVYFAGDTALFPGMDGLADHLDLALLPIWGWGPRLGDNHLTPESAAESLSLLRPRRVVPIHWGTLHPLGMGWLKPGFLTRPPCDFAEYAATFAPGVCVHVIRPGESLSLRSKGDTAADEAA